MKRKSAEKTESTEMEVYKFIGYPDEETGHILSEFIGACRFMWNRLKADRDDLYSMFGVSIPATPADYKDVSGLEWLNKVDSIALCNVSMNYQKAMDNFFAGEAGYPKFKKKGVAKASYTTNCSNAKKPNLKLIGEYLKLPKVKTPIKLNIHRKIKQGGILKNCTVTKEEWSGRWYFSLAFEYPKTKKPEIPEPDRLRHIGLDMSVPKLYVDSNGNSPEFIKAYKKTEETLAKEQHKLSRMKYNSNNYKKQKAVVAKLYAKTKHQRQDMLHKLSKYLTDNYDLISIEDLNIAALKRSLKLGKSISDNGWSMFVNMLKYKQERKGHVLIKVSRWFPSSKTCHECGHVHKELQLSDRTYVCPVCGNTIDRDEQAATNIDEEGLRLLIANGMKAPEAEKKTKSKKTSSKKSNNTKSEKSQQERK